MICHICHERPVRSNIRYRMCDVCRDKHYRYNQGRKCPTCGQAILNWSAYCAKHAQAYRSVVKTLTCEYCHGPFSDRKHPNSRRFCCRSHAAKFLYRNNHLKRIELFWAKVDKRGDDECWEWTGSRDNKWGYGSFHIGPNKKEPASRFAYEITFGSIPQQSPRLIVRHSCDNPPCCNPKHLLLGTDQNNSDDMRARKRDRHHRGLSNGNAKLTEPQVIEIRKLVKDGISQKDVAEQLHMSWVNVHRIVKHRLWKHLP